MLYRVESKFHNDLLKEFFSKLSDGTIENQKPDGSEIVASMKRAKIKDNLSLEWCEKCFCATPLKHERESIYDTYLYTFQSTLVDELKDDIEGNSFWEYMELK
jgi:hypothetical protein